MNGDLAVRVIQKNMKEFYEYNHQLENGEDADVIEEPMHFDAIILDLNMPIMDGFEACKQILQIYKEYNQNQIAWKDSSNKKLPIDFGSSPCFIDKIKNQE